MKMSQEGLKLLAGFEGLKLKPYLDSGGVATIGIGSTYYENGRKVRMDDMPITEARAYELLANTISSYELTVTNLLKVKVTQSQFDAMVSLCYNIGAANFAKSSVIRLVNLGDFTTAKAAFLFWNKVKGKVVKGLVNRRVAESNYFSRKGV